MIEAILPDAAACFSLRGEAPDDALWPQEAALLASAAPARRREFTAGRYCAHEALRRLGEPPVPILRDGGPAPRWPAGVAGSITHAGGFCAAAVARQSDLLSIGIDVEARAPLPDGVGDLVLVDAERRWLAAQRDGVPWDRLVFSAKESLYKAWWPLARAWLDFSEATIRPDVAAGTFAIAIADRAALRLPRSIDGFQGRFRIAGDLVLTAVTVAP